MISNDTKKDAQKLLSLRSSTMGWSLTLTSTDSEIGIYDLLSKKSTTPIFRKTYFSTQYNNRPLTQVEADSLMNCALNMLTLGQQKAIHLETLSDIFLHNKKHNDIYIKDLRHIDGLSDWIMVMQKGDDVYYAGLGKKDNPNIFEVNKHPMNPTQFKEFHQTARNSFTPLQQENFRLTSFVNAFTEQIKQNTNHNSNRKENKMAEQTPTPNQAPSTQPETKNTPGLNGTATKVSSRPRPDLEEILEQNDRVCRLMS